MSGILRQTVFSVKLAFHWRWGAGRRRVIDFVESVGSGSMETRRVSEGYRTLRLELRLIPSLTRRDYHEESLAHASGLSRQTAQENGDS
jgi:hypothetical protein